MVDLAAVIEAAKTGDAGELRRLLAAQPALAGQRLPSGESPLMAALYRGHHAIVDLLVDAGADVDVFVAAATGRLTDLTQALILPGAVSACSYDGWTPLHLAAFFGQLEVARVLLDAGASVAAVSQNGLANTPLHAAAAGKHEDLALLLLLRGADPDLEDAGGFTGGQIAAENGLHRVVAEIRNRHGSSDPR